jgi:hypothetical protein
MDFVKFSKIGQLAGLVHDVKKMASFNNMANPTIKFNGTVKTHGTNAGVSFSSDGEYAIQSRNRIITVKNDNAGFAAFATKNIKSFMFIDKRLRILYPELKDETLIIFGEWAGRGIQAGVSVTQLEKFFVTFAVKVQENGDTPAYYLESHKWDWIKDESVRIFNVNDFTKYEVEINFNDAGLITDYVTKLVDSVENECPIGKTIAKKDGIELVNTTGEGIVWVGNWNNQRFVWKAKGEKHSNTKSKRGHSAAPVDIEKSNNITEFIDYAVTENRMAQGITETFGDKDLDIRSLGAYLKWVANDTIEEEKLVLVKSGLIAKDVNKAISTKARQYFLKRLNDF